METLAQILVNGNTAGGTPILMAGAAINLGGGALAMNDGSGAGADTLYLDAAAVQWGTGPAWTTEPTGTPGELIHRSNLGSATILWSRSAVTLTNADLNTTGGAINTATGAISLAGGAINLNDGSGAGGSALNLDGAALNFGTTPNWALSPTGNANELQFSNNSPSTTLTLSASAITLAGLALLAGGNDIDLQGGALELNGGTGAGGTNLLMDGGTLRLSNSANVADDGSGNTTVNATSISLRGAVVNMYDGAGNTGSPLHLDGGTLDFGANPGGSPTNQATPAGWRQVTDAGGTYYLPIYQ